MTKPVLRRGRVSKLPALRTKRGKKMASPAKSGPNSNPELEGHEGANVDKIRDILFGSQMRDYDKRFGRLEERLIKDAESLRDEMKKRFESLETFVQKEIESLGQRLKTEKAERAEADKETGVQMRDTSKAFDKRLGSLDDQLTGDTAELRARILEQSKALTSEIGEKSRDMKKLLDQEVEALRTDKADREGLGDLFTEFGMRLKNEFNLPEK
jgi:hypothetical protein